MFLSYYKVHLLYFLLTTLLGAAIMYTMEKHRGVTFGETCFLAVSAVCPDCSYKQTPHIWLFSSFVLAQESVIMIVWAPCSRPAGLN